MSSTDFSSPELPALGIVSGLEDEDRRLLSDYGEFLPVQDGTTIIEEGAPQDCLIFLISGLLHVTTVNEGKRALLARIGPGETIGEVNLFDPGTASATVESKEFGQIWKARRSDLEEFLNAYPEAAGRLMMGLLAEMSRRIRNMNNRLANDELKNALEEFFK